MCLGISFKTLQEVLKDVVQQQQSFAILIRYHMPFLLVGKKTVFLRLKTIEPLSHPA
jgi:hypothetical protein